MNASNNCIPKAKIRCFKRHKRERCLSSVPPFVQALGRLSESDRDMAMLRVESVFKRLFHAGENMHTFTYTKSPNVLFSEISLRKSEAETRTFYMTCPERAFVKSAARLGMNIEALGMLHCGSCRILFRPAEIFLLVDDSDDPAIYFQTQCFPEVAMNEFSDPGHLVYRVIDGMNIHQDSDRFALITYLTTIQPYLNELGISPSDVESEIARLLRDILQNEHIQNILKFHIKQLTSSTQSAQVTQERVLHKRAAPAESCDTTTLVNNFIKQMADMGWKADVILTKIHPEESHERTENQVRTKPARTGRRIRKESSGL